MADRGVRRRGRGFGARGGFKRQQQREDEAGAPDLQNEAPEVTHLREKHGESVSPIQAMFPDWDEVSVLYALGDAGGSVELAISRILSGQAEQWGSVKPKKQQKKDGPSTETAHESSSSAAGAPVRGSFGGRGRGRGEFRGGRGGLRGGARGGRGGAASGRQPANGEVTVTEVTDLAASADGTVTATTVTEAEGAGVTEVSVKETSTDVEGTTVQVEESVAVVEAPKQAAKPTNGWAQKGKAPAVAQAAAAAPAAKKAPQPGAKLSWAQIARPPSPKPQPAPVPKAAPPHQTPAPAPTAPVEPVVVAEVVAAEPEAVIVVAEVEEPAQEAAQTASQDPWSSTPAAAVLEAQQPAEPTALAVGEGWADSIIAKNDFDQAQQITPEQQIAQEEQHQRAQEAAPPVGVNPAGALDVHTPAANELPTQTASQQTERMAPPGLTKRASAARGKQDAAVVMPGATPDIERMGVQFGSLNLFGSLPPATEAPAAEEAPQQPQQSLYETPAVQAQQPVQSIQDVAQQAQQAPAPYDIQQQAQAQYYQSQAPKQPSQYGGVFDRFGPAQQQYQAPQQQQQQQAPTSAYSSRYQPFGQPPAQQQQAPQDPFASVTSPYIQNVARAGSAHQQQPSIPSLTGADSISPYYSSQQAQNLQSHQSAQTQQSATSPAPQSIRESAGSVPPQQAASAYGGFTSAIGQAAAQTQQPQQQQQGYPSDYSNFYGMQDQTRNLQNYYGQSEQAAQQPYRASATDDLTAKLGASSNTATSGLGAQQPQGQLGQQQQQQQQHYNPNMMGGYGYGNPYYSYPGYGQGGYGNPGYPSYASHQAPYYGGYGGQSRNAYPGAAAGGHSHQNSTGAANNTPYGRNSGLGGYGNNASTGLGGSAGQHASGYGSNAYGSFDSSRNGQSGVQGLGQGQQDRAGSNSDAFNDPRYSSGY